MAQHHLLFLIHSSTPIINLCSRLFSIMHCLADADHCKYGPLTKLSLHLGDNRVFRLDEKGHAVKNDFTQGAHITQVVLHHCSDPYAGIHPFISRNMYTAALEYCAKSQRAVDTFLSPALLQHTPRKSHPHEMLTPGPYHIPTISHRRSLRTPCPHFAFPWNHTTELTLAVASRTHCQPLKLALGDLEPAQPGHDTLLFK